MTGKVCTAHRSGTSAGGGGSGRFSFAGRDGMRKRKPRSGTASATRKTTTVSSEEWAADDADFGADEIRIRTDLTPLLSAIFCVEVCVISGPVSCLVGWVKRVFERRPTANAHGGSA